MTSCTREQFLCTQIEELLGLADAAIEANQPGAAVAAKGKAADLRAELDKLRDYERDSKVTRSPLEETRAMRRRADAAGSHVAARDLLRIELELLEKEEAAEKAAAAERLEHLTEDEIVQMIVEMARTLPQDLRARVQQQAFAQVH